MARIIGSDVVYAFRRGLGSRGGMMLNSLEDQGGSRCHASANRVLR